MSESDDTDILLLISPDFFISNAERKIVREELEEKRRQFSSLQELNRKKQQLQQKNKYNLSRYFQAMDLANIESDGLCMLPPPSPCSSPLPPAAVAPAPVSAVPVSAVPVSLSLATHHDYHLPSKHKEKLEYINERLQQFQYEENGGGNLENPSDISSISMDTVRTHSKAKTKSNNLIHSTPKCDGNNNAALQSMHFNASKQDKQNYTNDSLLGEIDNFLLNGNEEAYHRLPLCNRQQKKEQGEPIATQYMWNDQDVRKTNSLLIIPSNALPAHSAQHPIAQSFTTVLTPNNQSDHQQSNNYQISKNENHLISLSDIWGRDGQATAICKPTQSTLKEEQLRRQHLEKTIRLLQSRLLEYQQRLSVAIEVDRTKDNALSSIKHENKNLMRELQHCRQQIKELEQQQIDKEGKLDALQKELAQALSLAATFQEKNEKLENDLKNYSRKSNESTVQYKQQIEQLEINVHACKRSEELAINELHKIKDKYAKSEHLYEKAKLQCDELEKESNTLRYQKDVLHDIQQKQRTRIDNLENQKKSLQDSVNHLTEIEISLKRKLDLQQKTLKAHYQQQLENVVKQKLNEFQEQLDKTEETLKTEARDRERLIAERAVKQLELINEKNEIELNLLQEKNTEEIGLYRIQLENATKKIDDLEMKLNVYKTKRADIAEKLHNVMETQWQKALEILTSPNQSVATTTTEGENVTNVNRSDADVKEESDKNTNTNRNEINNNTITPRINKKANNLNVQNMKMTAGATVTPVDKLQAYIELLLSKSPADFDKLDEILLLTTKAKQIKEKFDKNAKRQSHNTKPPWKA